MQKVHLIFIDVGNICSHVRAYRSIFFYDRIKLDELALMVLTVVDELGKFLADCFDVVEAGEGHIAIQIVGGGTRMYGEYLYRRIALLKFDGHHTHHGILGCLAGYISQRMPVGADF